MTVEENVSIVFCTSDGGVIGVTLNISDTESEAVGAMATTGLPPFMLSMFELRFLLVLLP